MADSCLRRTRPARADILLLLLRLMRHGTDTMEIPRFQSRSQDEADLKCTPPTRHVRHPKIFGAANPITGSALHEILPLMNPRRRTNQEGASGCRVRSPGRGETTRFLVRVLLVVLQPPYFEREIFLRPLQAMHAKVINLGRYSTLSFRLSSRQFA